jgi:hypothetical protein
MDRRGVAPAAQNTGTEILMQINGLRECDWTMTGTNGRERWIGAAVEFHTRELRGLSRG